MRQYSGAIQRYLPRFKRHSVAIFGTIVVFIILLTLSVPSLYTSLPGHGTATSRPHVNQQFNTSVAATIIEVRNLPILIPVLNNFLSVLSPDWPFKVWCSEANYLHLASAASLQHHIVSGRLNITLLPPEHDTSSGEALSRFLTKPWFWNEFEATEYLLFFQSDSILCSASPTPIENWLGFDWVGSPTMWVGDGRGGNGGLSIRRVPTMQRITNAVARPDDNGESTWLFGNAEDYWFREQIVSILGSAAKWPRDRGLHQADWGWTMGDAEKHHTRPFGYHKGSGNAEVFIDKTQPYWKELIHYCPEIQLILDFGSGKYDPSARDASRPTIEFDV